MEENRKFYVLDALRGIAALAVVQLHTSRFFDRQLFHHAGLAVDFFFMLSGFVLGFAYQAKLDGGWASKTFLKVWLIRLYPLYFLGLAIGALFWLLRAHFGHKGSEGAALFLALGILLLPIPPTMQNTTGFAFPLNIPTWSLFYEILANVFHALLLRRRSILFLSVFAGLSAIALVVTVERLQTIDVGAGQLNIYYGLARVVFAYTAGILIFFIWKKHRLPTNISPFIPAALLIAILAGPASSSVWYDLLAMIFFFPVLLFLGASSTPPGAGSHHPLDGNYLLRHLCFARSAL